MSGSTVVKPRKVLVARHGLTTRITHWINALALSMLLLSGLQIFNAHPALYWGQASTFASPWLAMTAEPRGDDFAGVTTVAGRRFETTGVLGYSDTPRGFPAWATLPSYRSLADGRRWHFFFAWMFVINGAIYLITALLGGHLRRDLWLKRAELAPRHLLREIIDHAQLRFPKGEEARRYNALQKGAYLSMALVFLPLMVATGLTMSPGFNAAAPWLLDLFGGRQSARSLHFISAAVIVAFVIVHLLMVVASGPWNNIRSMITGRYAIEIKGADQ
ncbi:cytochrome b/b6 domain-containing protein [Phenylobacterium sp.]|uniref:cytochrome b/b6 domain-containing protein n=1 Tax=Phenylobacterium sp. TaxID=1871053 RepID=UPI002732AD0B|nr:cytochrome b/b6 domain-containing protein [Phenylobacterium sp.]MDP3659733.1 cytochrome b/b6 domain-containing protein [Phenylobacterium sp.]